MEIVKVFSFLFQVKETRLEVEIELTNMISAVGS